MTPVRLEPVAPRSRVKHSTTEPLRSLHTCTNLETEVATGDRLVVRSDNTSLIDCAHKTLKNKDTL